MNDMFGIETQPRWGWILGGRFPRVARASQPWALGRNSVGIPCQTHTGTALISALRSKNVQTPVQDAILRYGRVQLCASMSWFIGGLSELWITKVLIGSSLNISRSPMPQANSWRQLSAWFGRAVYKFAECNRMNLERSLGRSVLAEQMRLPLPRCQ